MSDLLIVGTGPAGMAAARQAAELGLNVTLLDEQSAPGGQIFRDVDRVTPKRSAILGQDYAEGTRLTKALAHERITHIPGAVVWQIEEGGQVAYTRDGAAAQITGRRILLATGALERPMPVPGWTLPGVMTAGAAQILLKQSGIIAQRAVLAGSGPLLYLIAAQMVRAGTPPLALVETQTPRDFGRALRHLPGALRGMSYLLKGLGFLQEIKAARVPRYTASTDLAVQGEGYASGLQFTAGGRRVEIACDTVLLHQGVVPNTQAARSLGIAHRWNAAQRAFAPITDAWGATDNALVYIAGDGAGIGGAGVAEISGRLSALAIAADLGVIPTPERDARAARFRRAQAWQRAIRPFLDVAYPPYEAPIADDTIICRCEEVTAGAIRKAARLGCTGPNQTKAFVRAGMGPCQGRYCGLTVTRLLADANGASADATGYYRIRPPLKPVTLGELAAMDEDAS